MVTCAEANTTSVYDADQSPFGQPACCGVIGAVVDPEITTLPFLLAANEKLAVPPTGAPGSDPANRCRPCVTRGLSSSRRW